VEQSERCRIYITLNTSIYTLVPDIQDLLKRKGWFSAELQHKFSDDIAERAARQFNKVQTTGTLRLSSMGDRCPRALWHSIHTPGEAEPLPAWAEFKFAFGDVIEALAIQLARAAGHHVVGEQDELELDGVKGHRDCVIDGCLVDVKSCSGRQFVKYKQKTIEQSDGFGFLSQLDGYTVASASDPLVTVKDKGYILAIHKELGHICLYEHKIRKEDICRRVAAYKAICAESTPPSCRCGTTSHSFGNTRLDVRASYEPYKWCCFPELRCFLYSDGPVYLTTVKRIPDVPEINRAGEIIR
jgi:hypothetical protein